MLRRRIKAGISAALYGTGADKVIGRLVGIRNIPLVICYHRAVEDVAASARSSDAPMLISRRMLERHLDWVGLRFRLVSLEELGSRLESQGTFDQPVAAVTFDDGYSDVYTYAFPLLKRKGIPAAVFVATDLVGEYEAPPLTRDLEQMFIAEPEDMPGKIVNQAGQLALRFRPGNGCARHEGSFQEINQATTHHGLHRSHG